jgi:NAD(P)-dependent dehydrogenase (short-subunit alcohol dehydrogenase family)
MGRIAAALSTIHPHPAVRVVTGAASGIGRSVAQRLAADDPEGAVMLADIDAAGLDATAEVIRAAGGHAVPIPTDVSRASDCDALLVAATALGPVTALVNVAGIMAVDDSVELLPDEDLERVMAVNLLSIFRLGRRAIPAMRAAGGGTIVTMASVHAFATMERCASYASTKGAITALTRAMALDLARDGIRVVAVAPGSVDTPLTRAELQRRGASADEAGFSTDPQAIGRVAAPEEIAGVVAWLISPQAAVVNGTTVVADAGLLSKLV